MSKCLVYEGHITEIKGADFFTKVTRNDETLFVEFSKYEVREEEREYIQEGIGVTWYVTEKACAVRLNLRRVTASQIARADRLARELEGIFS